MKYTVHKLELNRPIITEEDKPVADGTIAIIAFRSQVAVGNLEPQPQDHLTERSEAATISAGSYLFTQGVYPDTDRSQGKTLKGESYWRDAAEAVWLESLWQNVTFKNDRILVRILSEDAKVVYQVFRELG